MIRSSRSSERSFVNSQTPAAVPSAPPARRMPRELQIERALSPIADGAGK